MKASFSQLLRIFAAVTALGLVRASAQGRLEAGFASPPDTAKAQVWWHWMNGNITREGITADLEAMKRVGLGGATIVNVDCDIPRGPVNFMSPEWREMFKFAVQEANRLGLELCVENCAGWSSSGGPWNTPEHAMQRLSSSETLVHGPSAFDDALAQPPAKLNFYRDVAVLAFKASSADADRASSAARLAERLKIKSAIYEAVNGRGSADVTDEIAAMVRNGQTTMVAGNDQLGGDPAPGSPKRLRVEYVLDGKPGAVTAQEGRTLHIPVNMDTGSNSLHAPANLKIKRAVYEATDDGGSADVTARVSELVKSGQLLIPARSSDLGGDPAYGHAKRLRVEYTLDGKAGTAVADEGDTLRIPANAKEMAAAPVMVKTSADRTFVGPPSGGGYTSCGVIPRDGILDLTAKLGADGRLQWDVPPGDWIILRIGHTPSGTENHPAPTEGRGLECDKFSTAALDAHWAGFVQKLVDDIGPLAGQTLTHVLIDSYEVGNQDWSEKFRAEFQKRRGYDPLKYLPTFTGRVVDSPEITERFLWDMRRTVADLFADNYYGHFQELCHQAGLQASIEPYTGPFESLQSGRAADLVMGEFWSGSQGDPSVKLAASVAHIYGKQIVGAESFTAGADQGRWQNDPWSLKALGDLMYCTGLNRYIFHRYAMQPWTNRWPGMTMGPWGFHFERTVTWWEQGKAWLDYVSRCQFLLQQGRFVADAAYFCGEGAPVEMRPCNPPLPPGYDYDAINADVLLHSAEMKNGRLTLTDGASYSVLVLPPDDKSMTPLLLRRIRDFVLDGLTVIGAPPSQHSPSLQDYPGCDEEVKSLANELWGAAEGRTHHVGKGTVMWHTSMTDVFSQLGLKPDFEFKSDSSGAKLVYCHRIDGNADIYFVSNQRRQADAADCTFRVDGKLSELWHADTGVIEPAPIWSRHDGRTTVRIPFDAAGSVFVVFQKPAGNADHVVAANGSMSASSMASIHKLEIKYAAYEETSGGGSMNVRDKLAGLVTEGQTDILVDNDVLGRDPAPNQPKQLKITYTLDGKTTNLTVAENEILTLPAGTGQTLPFAWQVVNENGWALVKTSGNGEFKLHTANGRTLKASVSGLPAPIELTGEWSLKFPPNWGAPAEVKLDRLISWTDHPDSGVRYFSGTAVYEKQIEVPAEFLQNGREIWLDLGRVKNFAEVSLNGRPLATLWKPPFRVQLTGAGQAGFNLLQVKVTNLWPNRLIGDEQLPADRDWSGKALASWPQWLLDGQSSPTGRLTFTTWHHWTRNDQPLPSGLLGPVRLETVATVTPK